MFSTSMHIFHVFYNKLEAIIFYVCAESKVISLCLNVKVKKRLDVSGHPMKIRTTPKVGFAELFFLLKSTLQMRREKFPDFLT